MSRPFREGEPCLLVDPKGRRYLVRLQPGMVFRSHLGDVPHEAIMAAVDGGSVASEAGTTFTIMRPRLADFVLKMKRGAQVVYPKDLGPILIYADVGPGATVVEAGTGSGALTMALVRAVGPAGRVVTVERRADHAEHARKMIERYFGGFPETLEMRAGDVEEVIDEVRPDRLVLDVPEPWHAASVAVRGLQGGGVFCAYVPTVPQMQQTVETLRELGCYVDISSFEVMLRTWNVVGRSVRPDHRMVGHTGFITVARKIEPIE